MKVYVIMFYGIDEADIMGVFSTLEKAQAECEKMDKFGKSYHSIVPATVDGKLDESISCAS